ncbi:MAG TPA: rhomboid family intramembrane serine protease [Planctomycetes bacterium]|nr:rhomboid family intramembrane serine protease [Planctomycetota bacterium]
MSTFRDPSHGGGGMHISLPKPTPAVRMLLILNFGIYLVQFVLYLGASVHLSQIFGLSLADVTDNPLNIYRFLSYQFLHSETDLWHILMNMLVLYFFGTMVEPRLGARSFVRFYLLSGVLGGLFWVVFSGIAGAGAVPVVGASGAVYGVLAYAALTQPNAKVFFLIVLLPLWVVGAAFGLFALFNTLLALRGRTSGVADAAHLGGMVFGAFWWKFGPQLSQWRAMIESRKRMREREGEMARKRELDRILQKIQERGMNSLSSKERRFLDRYSRDSRK